MTTGPALFLKLNSVRQCRGMCAICSQSRKASYAMAAFSTLSIPSGMSKSSACWKQPLRISIDSCVYHDLPALSSTRSIASFEAAIWTNSSSDNGMPPASSEMPAATQTARR